MIDRLQAFETVVGFSFYCMSVCIDPINVWIGSNAAVAGNIHIGSNVLIAPLSFVDFDVPDNSIVIGNPVRIIPREKATDKYIQNQV